MADTEPFRYNDIAYKSFESWFETYGLTASDLSDGLNSTFFSGRTPWVDADAFIQPGDNGDDALAVQRAIDHAQTFVDASNSTGAPDVRLTPRLNRWRTPITLKSARLVGTWPNQSCRVYWDGGAGSTVVTKAVSYAGGVSWGGLEGINFRYGTAEPATWLDLTQGTLDFGFRLREMYFGGGTSDAIKVRSFLNGHWEHLRFDSVGGYCIRFTPFSTQALGNFRLDGFTIDNARADSLATGMLMIDNSAGATNLGTFALKHGRIEVNTAWSGNKSIISLKLPDASAPARSCSIELDNVTYQDNAGMSGDSALYQETAVTNLFPTLILKNFRQQGLTSIVGGSLSSSFPAIPLQGNYQFLGVSNNGGEMISGSHKVITPSGAADVYAIRQGNETVDRFTVQPTGELKWGSGSGAVDTNLKRNAADQLKTDDKFLAALGIGVGNSAAATTPGTVVKKMEVFDASGNSLGFVPIYDAIT